MYSDETRVDVGPSAAGGEKMEVEGIGIQVSASGFSEL